MSGSLQVSDKPSLVEDGGEAGNRNIKPAFDKLEFWKDSPLTSEEKDRLQKTIEIVPDSVNFALDVGCGDGRVSGKLRERCGLVSLDLNKGALLAAGGITVQASAANLPFLDCSFDLVCCTEVLEHLPDDLYESAIREMVRVSSRYILLSVPFEEDLLDKTTKCAGCDTLYHLWDHRRSFTLEKLRNLAQGFELVKLELIGSVKPSVKSTRWIRRKMGGQWPVNRYVSCPSCGHPSGVKLRKNPVTYACAVVERLIPRTGGPRWAVCLFKRN